MHRLNLVLFALIFVLSGSPAANAQNATASIDRLLRIADEMEQLLARIQRGGSNQTAQTESILFDGKSMDGWKRTDFFSGGKVEVVQNFRGGSGVILVDAGATLSGFNWTRDVPRTNYEISLEAMKVNGNDFFCGLTFPVANSHASLIMGGWGGLVIGISSIDGRDASENNTTKSREFPKDQWYTIRMRVTQNRLQTWLNGELLIDQDITDRMISLRSGDISKSVPLGISTYKTSAAFRNIRLRRLGSNER